MNLVTMKKSDSVVTKYATVKNQMHIMTLNNQMKKKHQTTEASSYRG
jgi:hypothetical protein